MGITGGIGSGKSLIGKIFHRLGVPIYDADSRAKWLMNNNVELIAAIKDLFGEKAYDESGLNRQHISSVVFNQPEKLAKLNGLVHPKVGEDFEEWAEQNAEQNYLLKEAALMFETDSFKQLDEVITVSAPVEVRINRVLKRDSHRNKEDIEKIIAHQLTDAEREKRANHIINNDGQHLLIPQVLTLHQKFIQS